MNDNQVLEAIDKYIETRLYNYAIMINGKWGCGKTFFVTQTLIPYLAQKHTGDGKTYDVNYVSLYGIKEPAEISDALFAQAIEDKLHNGIKLNRRGAHAVTNIIEKAINLGYRAIGGEEKDIKELLSTFADFDNNIIIFDDLERCTCDINTVMGYINNFVEHSDAYVIVVANEDEIGRWQLGSNSELQMLILLNKRFDVPVPQDDEEEIAAYARQYRGEPGPDNSELRINPEKMRKMREYAFNNNEQYKQIKEKVIGLTINYNPDLADVYLRVIRASSLESTLCTILSNLVDYFVGVARSERHSNIRSFQFFLEKAKTIFDVIGEQPPFVYEAIIKYCFRSSVRYMKGTDQEAWDSEYGIRCFGSPFVENDNLYGFRFIDEFIITNVIAKDEVLSSIKHFTDNMIQMGKLSDDPVSLIRDWYLYDDEQIYEWLLEIQRNICKGKYSTYIFPVIIKTVAVLEKHGIADTLGHQVIDSMKEHINHASYEDIDAFGHEQFFIEGKAAEIYKHYKSEISEEMHKVLQNSEKEQWHSLIVDENQWASNLLIFARSCSGAMRSFIYWIEPQKLYSLALESKNEQLFAFRRALAEVYNSGMFFSHREDDLQHLEELGGLFENAECSIISKTKQAHFNWLVNDIKEYAGIVRRPIT